MKAAIGCPEIRGKFSFSLSILHSARLYVCVSACVRIYVCAVLVRAYLYACVRVVTCAQYLCARIRVRVHNRVRLRLWGVLKKGKKSDS